MANRNNRNHSKANRMANQPGQPQPSMTLEAFAALVRAYPYMFAGPFIELVMYAGWHTPFTKLCDDIDAALGDNKRGFRWIQLKEKFGQPRWYWEMDGESDLVMDMRFAPATGAQDQPAQAQINQTFRQTYRKTVPGEVFVCIRQLVDTADATDERETAVGPSTGIQRDPTAHGAGRLQCRYRPARTELQAHCAIVDGVGRARNFGYER